MTESKLQSPKPFTARIQPPQLKLKQNLAYFGRDRWVDIDIDRYILLFRFQGEEQDFP